MSHFAAFGRWNISLLCCLALSVIVARADDAGSPLRLTLRSRTTDNGGARFRVRFTPAEWKPSESAVIVVDMWDNHWCPTSAARVVEIAPRIDAFVAACRDRGVRVIHAPSDCMNFYADHPARRRAIQTPKAGKFPDGIDLWCKSIPAEERGKYPIDQSDGGCDAENPPNSANVWKRQIDSIRIDPDRDYISASGSEVWSILEEQGVKNVLLLGVHTNMCVLGRPFGLRNLSRFGKNAVLVRDLTDTMYNPQASPQVNHFRGTQLIVEHIEKYVTPTITSDQVLGGAPFRFAGDVRPLVVVAISEPEYKTDETLPVFAAEELETRLGYDCFVLHGDPQKHVLPGLAEGLKQADLLLMSIRRQALPEKELAAIRKHVEAGKAIVGIRTASHAFDARKGGPAGSAQWPEFDAEVFGGHYTGHHGSGATPKVTVAEGAEEHPILKEVSTPFVSPGSLYKTSPLAPTAQPLLFGTASGLPREPVAWTNHRGQSRVFYTSLGHEDDFEDAGFVRMLANAVEWGLGK